MPFPHGLQLRLQFMRRRLPDCCNGEIREGLNGAADSGQAALWDCVGHGEVPNASAPVTCTGWIEQGQQPAEVKNSREKNQHSIIFVLKNKTKIGISSFPFFIHDRSE